jgi:hypothetical protein
MGMLLVTEMLTVHDAKMKMAERLKDARTLEEIETYGNLYNKLARTFATLMETLQRWCSGPQLSLQYNVSVNDGGQAAFGTFNRTGMDKDKVEGTQAPSAIADQSGLGMPVIQPDEHPAATVPRIEQDREAAPAAKKRRRSG